VQVELAVHVTVAGVAHVTTGFPLESSEQPQNSNDVTLIWLAGSRVAFAPTFATSTALP
jgi:hypothetical protein